MVEWNGQKPNSRRKIMSKTIPVAWITDSGKGELWWHKANESDVPLYLEPPKREWVGLTDDEIEHLRNDQPWWMVRDIEAKLKDKNGD